HQFYHKWALLTDPDDIAGGPKGYLKCDISVIGKGDTVKVPPKSEKDEDDIEANLLLPDGVPTDRQKARVIVKIYRADGLPKMNSSLMANVKKAFTGELNDLVDPYVQVSFAGLMGKTSVKKHSYAPVWNEQLIFTEMFPPLCQRIKIQLRDNDPVKPTVIGTHFIDLKRISNDGEKGFLPTFGPSFIHLYGSTRDYSLIDEHSSLNAGLGEGVSYRARLLISIRTEITDSIDLSPASVDLEPVVPVNEASYAKNEEFFLFACILEASIVDKKLGDKPVYFEISIGNAGNAMDGHNESTRDHYDSDSDELGCAHQQNSINAFNAKSNSLYVSSHGLNRVAEPIRLQFPLVNELIKIFIKAPLRVQLFRERFPNTPLTPEPVLTRLGTWLDAALYYAEYFENFNSLVLDIKDTASKSIKDCQDILGETKLQNNLGFIKSDFCFPQHALPDVFLWIISGGKRQAYQRIPARDIIYSGVEEECGKHCGKVQTMFLKEDALSEVTSALEADDSNVEIQFKQVLEDLSVICGKYVTICKASLTGPGTGKTKLDKEHIKLCQREIEQIGVSARNLKALVTKSSFKERFKTAQKFLGKLKFLIDDLPGKKGIGPSGWSIPAKLQIFLWLGLLKHKKNFLTGIPGGYEQTHEIKNVERPRALPPSTIHYVEKHIFQLRAHIYQARSLIGSDASGLSDPFARIIAGEFSKTTQVIDETLSPTWDELLIFEEILIYGDGDEIKNDPPPIVIEIFDQDKVGKSEFIGRTLAKPNVKLREDPYTKPKFPPSLEWFTISRGADRAGELLAAFELLEISNEYEGSLPSLPHPKDIPMYHETDPKRVEQLLPVPRGIRPTLVRYRIEVLFWGLRDLKRIHLLTVDKPRVDIECSGNILYSSIIQNRKKNPNFSTPVKFLDLDLPEQELYRPPLTIRAVDCRSFGRYTLVGTHIINSIQRYMYKPMTKKLREAEERKKSLHQLKTGDSNVLSNQVSASNMAVSHNDKERTPLLPKDISIQIGYGTHDGTKKIKAETNKRRKQSFDEEIDDEDENKDCTVLATMAKMLSAGAIRVYKWPLPKDIEDKTIMGFDPQFGLFQGLPCNDPIRVLVRVYIVKANDLHPMDLNGKADPYVVLQLGSKRISDKENYISKQLNPVFGK
uniref:Otoferlin-like n=1 Tax=Diabrotica virgifera virgifera TaxID=50390 RepID=A0A6P7GTG0_DIAVI